MASSVWNALEAGGASVNAGMGLSSDAFLNQHLASALSTMGDAQYWEESISPTSIRQSLSEVDPSNPSHSSTILRGMKWLLASVSKGRDVSDFYPHVVKLVGAYSLEVRKMVYMYLEQYADQDPTTRELSLLSINAFQRGLADTEQWIRALALRVLTSIRLADILQIQILGVQKCSQDSSPYVRKCAANALSKLHPRCAPDPSQQTLLLEILQSMLDRDKATMVLTSALIAFQELCPERLELLHGSFRKTCHLLTDMDEWGQVVTIEILARYCRRFFKEPLGWRNGSAEQIDRERRVRRTVATTRPVTTYNANSQATSATSASPLPDPLSTRAAQTGVSLPTHFRDHVDDKTSSTAHPPRKVKRRVVKEGFYSDEEDASTEEEVYVDELNGPSLPLAAAMRQRNILGLAGPDGTKTVRQSSNVLFSTQEDTELAEDHQRLLHAAMPLLKSRNAGVVLATCSLQYYCGISSIQVRAAMGRALVRIHRDCREIQYVVLTAIRDLVKHCPSAFAPFLHDFFVKALDPPFTRLIKLDILTSLALEPAAIKAVLQEMRSYVRDGHVEFVRHAIRAVGRTVELARIVYDRHGQKSGKTSVLAKERAETNSIALDCLHGLLTLTQTSDHVVIVGECVCVMQRILQLLQAPEPYTGEISLVKDPNNVQQRAVQRILILLVYTLSSRVENAPEDDEDASEPTVLAKIAVSLSSDATASALWVVGSLYFAPLAESPLSESVGVGLVKGSARLEVARLIARAFLEMEAVEKEQAIHFASRILVSKATSLNGSSSEEFALCEVILSMARTDVNVDVRDRARFESNLVRATVGLQHDTDAMEDLPVLKRQLTVGDAKRVLLASKPACSSLPLEDDFSTVSGENGGFRFGTLSSLVGHRARKAYLPLPRWADQNSSDTLRVPIEDKKTDALKDVEGETRTKNTNGANEFYESSDDDEQDSSSESSSQDSSDEAGSSSDSYSDESSSSDDDDESSSDDSDVGMQSLGQDATLIPMEVEQREIAHDLNSQKLPLPVVENVDGSSSSEEEASSTSSDDETSTDSYKLSPKANGGTHDGTFIPLDASSKAAPAATSTIASSLASDFEGMTLAPAIQNQKPQLDPDRDRDSSAWQVWVRPEHANGLLVKIRYLRGPTRSKEAQVLVGTGAEKPSLVLLQVRFENSKDTTVRRLRILQRASASGTSSSIAPRKMLLPPEIDQLKKGQTVDHIVAIEFASVSDREGAMLAKLEVKFSTGGIPVEIKPSLCDLLLPCFRSVADFDQAVARLQGFQRVDTRFPMSDDSQAQRDTLMSRLMRTAPWTMILEGDAEATRDETWPGQKLRLAGTLPASSDPVYVLVTITGSGITGPSSAGGGCQALLSVCSDNALAVNSILNTLKKTVQNLSDTETQ
jgi:AP-3 complex subunit beta